jgi:ammonium transporter, Amt family
MFWIMLRTGKPDPAMMANGMLAGLVAITAPCAFIDPWAAAVIGIISGVVVIEATFFIDQKLKIDDPVGAVAVHGVNGFLGVIWVGIFANGDYGSFGDGVGWNFTEVDGIRNVEGLIEGDGGQFVAQLVGAIVIAVFGFVLSYIFFKIIDKTMGMRSNEEDEIAGLDIPEMGVPAYVFTDDFGGGSTANISEAEKV